MTETQKRIDAYKKALPHMKERVMAVALLFVMSITMMASASFAWITLSRSPEISGLSTSIATNGNLEIALSDKDGLEPDPTSTTDGSGDVTKTNLTWGNLINLSHSSYGLSSLTLRPAELNDSGPTLLKEPLSSVVYDADGRITSTISNFAYTNYGQKDGGYAFFVPENGVTQYGVRAISSVTYSSVAGDAALHSLTETAKDKYTVANNKFKTLWNNKKYMNSITGLAGVYLNWRMSDNGNGGNVDQACDTYVEIVYEMMGKYKECLQLTGEALVAAANVHHFVYCNNNSGVTYSEFTLENLHDGTVRSTLLSQGMSESDETIKAIDAYIADHTTFNVGTTSGTIFEGGVYNEYYNKVYIPWSKSEWIGWELMSKYVNAMAHIDSATINGTPASSIGSDALISLALASSKICELQKGLIWNMDWFYGGNISVSGVSVKISLLDQPVILTQVRTSVKSFVEDPEKTNYTSYPVIEAKNAAVAIATQGGLAATDAVAADTYGMAIDFWLKTNSANSLLGLAGKVKKDAKGNAIGYSGENRIWEEGDPELPVLGESTSQGSGSCYIFYPNSLEERDQALKLLSAMRVAFIDDRGNILSIAYMDISNAFEDVGRVLVPLQLEAKSIVTGTDKDGNEIREDAFYVTSMVQNEETRITAIVYLDGAVLDNSSVLASGSIKGQLNIQFCTSENLVSVDDPVKSEFINYILEADKDSFDKYDPNNKPKVKLTLVLSGVDATTVTGQFVSFISATQGANQPEFSFTKKTAGTWEAEVTFNGPGNFQLRSIRIDGVDYSLYDENPDKNQIITVNIKGLSIENLTFTNWKDKVMTTEAYYQIDSLLTLKESEGMTASKVQAVFAHDEGQNVTVDYTKTNNGWEARPLFTTSGKYTLTYLIIDGSYIPLPESMCKELTLYLGLKTQIFLGLPMTERYAAALEALDNDKEEEINLLLDEQEAEISAVEANTQLSDEEKTAQIASIEAKYEALIADVNKRYEEEEQKRYAEEYGEDGFEMESTASGYKLTYDGSEPMFLDTSCIITDDKGNVMTDLENVVLHYGIGASETNRIDTTLVWNPVSERYEAPDEGEGRFVLTKPGAYTFQKIEIGTGEEKSTIYVASKAPKLTAISPIPMEYIGAVYNGEQLNPEKLTEISSAYSDPSNKEDNRLMTIVLKNAGAASVKFEMYNAEGNETVVLDGTALYTDDSDPNNVISEFIPTYKEGNYTDYGVPYDGTWTITGMKVANVFYNEVYYDGSEESENGWLDLAEFIANDEGNLTTEFFTTVKLSANKQPNAKYDDSPLKDHIVSGMVLTITDYFNKPIEDINVFLSYTWDQAKKPAYYEIDSGSYPNTSFGGTLTSKDGIKFNMPDMNFQQAGEYAVNFGVTIEGITYNNTNNFIIPANGSFTASNVEVNYTVLPILTVTDVTGALKDDDGNVLEYNSFTVDLNTTDNDSAAYNPLAGVTNYYEDYYANLYIETTGKGKHSIPEARLQLVNTGIATEASVSMSTSDWSATYTFNSDNNWSDVQNIGGTEEKSPIGGALGELIGDGVNDRYWAGKQTISTVKLKYGNYNYNIKLTNEVIINQDKVPLYAKVNVDTTKVSITSLSAVDSNGNTFETPIANSSVVNVISPNGKAFKLRLPELLKTITRYEDADGVAVFEKEEGEPTNEYKHTSHETTEGCGGNKVIKYTVYGKYIREGVITATRTTYEDTNTVKTWTVGSSSVNSNTEVTISETTVITANITTNSVNKGTAPIDGEPITQYCWKEELPDVDEDAIPLSSNHEDSMDNYKVGQWQTVTD